MRYGARRSSLAVLFALDALVDLLAMHRDVLRGVDPDANLVPFDPQDSDGNLVSDHHRLADSSRQYQHDLCSSASSALHSATHGTRRPAPSSIPSSPKPERISPGRSEYKNPTF